MSSSRVDPPARLSDFRRGDPAASAERRQAVGRPFPRREHLRDLSRRRRSHRHDRRTLHTPVLARPEAAPPRPPSAAARQGGRSAANGEFGERLVDHARRWRLEFQVLRTDWGQGFHKQEIRAAFARAHPARAWMVLCETSTGVRNDLSFSRDLCRQHRADLCLDGVSAAGLQTIDLAGIRFASAVAGKAIGAYPGLAIELPINARWRLLPRAWPAKVSYRRSPRTHAGDSAVTPTARGRSRRSSRRKRHVNR